MNRPIFFGLKRWQALFATLHLIIAVSATLTDSTAVAQTEPPPPSGIWAADSDACSCPTTQYVVRPDALNLVDQAAAQNKDIVIENIEALLCDNFRQYNDTYVGPHTFGGDDINSLFFANAPQLIGKWISEGKETIGVLIALMIFMPNKRMGAGTLHSRGARLILFMTLVGIAFANLIG